MGGEDARRHRWQVLSIALLLALGVGMFSAMSSMSVWRVDSADSSFAALRMHDLRVSLVEGSTAREGALRSALERSAARADVAAARERLVVATQVDASAPEDQTIRVPGRIVGTRREPRSTRSQSAPGACPPPQADARPSR